MAALSVLAMTLLGFASAGIYPDGHFDYVTKMTVANHEEVIKSNVDAGKTLFVRWIASEGWGWWRKQAPAWNVITEKYKENSNVAFADVNLSEEQVRGNYNPGMGGWPTIRYFNAETGYEGKPYPKKTDKAMCDELGDEKYMEEYVMEQGGVYACAIADGEGCSEKEKKYIAKLKSATEEYRSKQLTRLNGMKAGKMKPELMKWIKQRIAILGQFAEEATPAGHEEL